MVCQQHEVLVEKVDALLGRLLGVHHPEEIPGVAELGTRLDEVALVAAAVRRGNDRRHDGRERDRLGDGRLLQCLGGALRRDGGAQDVHGVGVILERGDDAARGVLELSRGGHLLAQRVEPRPVRQLAIPQQVRGLLEGDGRREVFDQISAAIDEATVGAVDLADRGLGGDDSLQPGAVFGHVY